MSAEFGDMQMVSFAWAEGEPNISGALVKMRDMKPVQVEHWFTLLVMTVQLKKVVLKVRAVKF